jgi:hypothetical protein
LGVGRIWCPVGGLSVQERRYRQERQGKAYSWRPLKEMHGELVKVVGGVVRLYGHRPQDVAWRRSALPTARPSRVEAKLLDCRTGRRQVLAQVSGEQRIQVA